VSGMSEVGLVSRQWKKPNYSLPGWDFMHSFWSPTNKGKKRKHRFSARHKGRRHKVRAASGVHGKSPLHHGVRDVARKTLNHTKGFYRVTNPTGFGSDSGRDTERGVADGSPFRSTHSAASCNSVAPHIRVISRQDGNSIHLAGHPSGSLLPASVIALHGADNRSAKA
jgi:hypothetical protein